MSEQTSYPLSWPTGWKRTANRQASRFRRECRPGYASRDHSMEDGTQQILLELARMNVPDYRVVISTNVPLRRDGRPYSGQKQPADPGVAVYFKMPDRQVPGAAGKPCVLACDKWDRVECNLWAIAKHIEALRGQDRWGVGTLDQAFAGYAALPAPGGSRDWWVVLGVDRAADMPTVKAAYREMARVFHPDAGGTQGQMAEINAALARAKFEKGER